MAVVGDEVHDRAEGEWLGEAVVPITVEDLDQFIVPAFSRGG